MERMLNVGLGPDSNPTAIAAAERHAGVFATVGSHPTSAGDFDDALEAEILRLSEHEKVRAIGETGIDHYRDTATPAEQRRAFEAQIEIARERRLPIVIHARDRDGETTATDECFDDPRRPRRGPRRDPPLLPRARGACRTRSSAAGTARSRGSSPSPGPTACARPPRRCRRSCSWSRPTPRTWRRSRCAASPTSPPTSSPPRGRSPRRAAKPTSSSSARSRPTPARSSAGEEMVRLGQNFLADPNLLDAIVRDAALEPGDVVLEVGPGEGVLTERLAQAAGHVHAVEIDRGLEGALAALAERPGVELHWADAMKFDFGALDPAPTAMVANLPYAVATPVILRTIEELPSLALLDRDGPARDRRPAARRPGQPHLRLAQRRRPARLRGEAAAHRRSRRLPAPAADRVGDPRPEAHRAGRRPGNPPSRPRRLRPPAQVPGALARARPSRERSPRRAAHSPSWAWPKTRAPRRSRPSSSPPCRRSCRRPDRHPDEDPRSRKAQPLPFPRPAPGGRPARALLAVRAAEPRRRDRGLRGRARRGDLPGRGGEEPGGGRPRRAARAGLAARAVADRDREADPGRGRARRRVGGRGRRPAPRRRRGGGDRGAGGGDRRRRPLAARPLAVPWSRGRGRGSPGCPTRSRTPRSCCPAAEAWRPRTSSPRQTVSASAAAPPSSRRWPSAC